MTAPHLEDETVGVENFVSRLSELQSRKQKKENLSEFNCETTEQVSKKLGWPEMP